MSVCRISCFCHSCDRLAQTILEFETMESLSIFFPFYNDAGTVEKMITDAFEIGGKLSNRLQVVAVNDGSTDHTLKELRRLGRKYHRLEIINHRKNRGYGGALISGIRATRNKWVFYTDGDAQYHLDDLPTMWKHREGYDVVNGFKVNRGDGVGRSLVGKVYRRITKAIFQFPIVDIDCDFRLINGNLIRSLDLRCTSGAITVEMVNKLAIAGASFKELPVSHYDRVYGRSMFFTPERIYRTIRDELRLISKFRRT